MQDLPSHLYAGRSTGPFSTEQRNRNKTNIVRKVNQIKEAFRIKNRDDCKFHDPEDPATVVPTFQTDVLSSSRNYIKFFIPVVMSRNISNEPLKMGDLLLDHYRLDTIVFESELFDLYEGTLLQSSEKVQIKVYGQKEQSMNLAMNEIAKYMQIYEQRDRYFEEGAINKLKDFFFFRNKLILVFESRGISLSRIRKELSVSIKKTILTKILTTLKHFSSMSLLHLDLNPSWISLKQCQGDCEVSISNLMRSQIKQKGTKFSLSKKAVPGLNYYSPEALLQLEVDEKSDIWSVGCVLYWLYSSKSLLNPQLSGKQMIYVIKKSLESGDKTPSKNSMFESLEMFSSLEHSKGMNNKLQMIEDGIQDICQQLQKIQRSDRQLYDLLTRMLAINPNRRICVEQALTHPWLQ